MRIYVVLALAVLQWSTLLQAQAATLHVVDQHGQPLEGAIVEFTSTVPTPRHTSVAVMDQIDKRFLPEQLIVQRGDSVSFPNSDEIRHHVYSFSPTKTFELKLYKGKHGEPLTMDTAGVVVLGCNIHDAMVGYIYVADKTAVATDQYGQLKFSPQADLPITAWHPNQAIELHSKTPITGVSGNQPWQVTITTTLPPARDTFSERFQGNAAISP